MINKRAQRLIRHKRVRSKIFGTAARPRLSIFKSNKHIHLQLIDDEKGLTLVSASTLQSADLKGVVKSLVENALKQGIKEALFDRGGYKYHGKIKSIAEIAREGGLKL